MHEFNNITLAPARRRFAPRSQIEKSLSNAMGHAVGGMLFGSFFTGVFERILSPKHDAHPKPAHWMRLSLVPSEPIREP